MVLMNGLDMYGRTQGQGGGDIVARYAPLVKKVARHLMARLPANVQIEDLLQSGMIGLLEAASKYDAGKGASFETYASIRIRGAMVDEVRRNDWAPRSVHRNGRRVAEAIKAVEGRTGRDARDAEIAQEMGVGLDEYYACLQDSAGSRLFSLDELQDNEQGPTEIPDGCMPAPGDECEQEAFRRSLTEAIGALPERERLVLALYYNEEMNLKEIGAVLSVSESRVSQIHSQAALRLRSRLSDWK